MRHRCLACVGALATVMAALAPVPAAGQAVADPWTPPRTPWGEPDLQGIWDFRTITPLERPDEHEGKQFLTEEEAAEFEQQAAETHVDRPPAEGTALRHTKAGEVGVYNQFWFDRGSKVNEGKRTSLIVDPPDGKIPPLRPGAEKQDSESTDAPSWVGERPIRFPVRFPVGGVGADGPEDRGWSERCILGFNTGPPMRPSSYNNNVQLFQVPGYVVILHEMVHDVRIVPLDGRSHLPEHIRQWRGDSRGHWEGDTLVLDTTNFTDKTASFNPTLRSAVGSGETLHLIERFTRVDADTLLYEFTVDDPTTFTRSFTAAVATTKTEAPMFEYACHEGNYGMFNLLVSARAVEKAKAAEEAAKTGSQ